MNTLTFVAIVSSILSSVVVCKTVTLIVSMVIGGEVDITTVGDSNIDETATTSIVVDRTTLLSVFTLTEVLLTARSLPVITIFDIELMSSLLEVGRTSTVAVEKTLKL